MPDQLLQKKYKYNGARAMILLHETHLKSFLETWKKAKSIGIVLPQTDDKDYESMNTLLKHLFRAARGYKVWICEKLDLTDPEIDEAPDIDVIEFECNNYLLHLLDKWRLPLVNVPTDKFSPKTYTSRWGAEYCIDAMLEHAVMHPIRHEFQLKNLIKEKQKK